MADALNRLPRPSGTPAIIKDTPVEPHAVIAALKGEPPPLESIQQHTDEDTTLSQVKQCICTCWPNKKCLDTEILPYYYICNELPLEKMYISCSEHRFVLPTSL